jgi:fused signal recognition particle receptor
MEPWQIVLVVILVAVAAGVAYAVLRKRKAPPPAKEPGEKEVTTKKVEKGEMEKIPVGEEERRPPPEKEAAKRVEGRRPPPPKPGKAEEEPSKERIVPIRKGLEKTRGGLISKLKKLVSGKKELSTELLGEIEELLITSDVGVGTTQKFIDFLKDTLSKKELMDSRQVWDALREKAREILSVDFEARAAGEGGVYTIMVVGVNGVGKTTTIGKLASRYQQEGRKVVLAAADTFRAAAVSQLEIWGRRVGCEVVKGKEGADPASVVFDAIDKAAKAGGDVVIADTAGRLHTKVPLMEELKKLRRVMAKAQEGSPHEVLLVLDATTGQNGVAQAKSFLESMEITGIVLTKLDGTARGGVILGICNDMQIPVRYIGIGEGVEDLKDFNAEEFVAALFDEISEKEIAA